MPNHQSNLENDPYVSGKDLARFYDTPGLPTKLSPEELSRIITADMVRAFYNSVVDDPIISELLRQAGVEFPEL